MRVSPYDGSTSKRPYLLIPSLLESKGFNLWICGRTQTFRHSTIFLLCLWGPYLFKCNTFPGLNDEVTAYLDTLLGSEENWWHLHSPHPALNSRPSSHNLLYPQPTPRLMASPSLQMLRPNPWCPPWLLSSHSGAQLIRKFSRLYLPNPSRIWTLTATMVPPNLSIHHLKL